MSKYKYDYYSGEESSQFRFLRIPKVFFEDPDYGNLGSDEKILYGFLHEQVDMSQKNGWIDEEGHTYVLRSMESMQQILHNCSPDKVRATIKNLIDLGLIEKKRRGKGRQDMIYVKNFITKKSEISCSEKNERISGNFSEHENTHIKNTEKPVSRSGKFRVLETGNSGPKETSINDTKYIYNPSIHLPESIETNETDGSMDSRQNKEVQREQYEKLIKANIEYDIKMFDLSGTVDQELFDDFYNLILEIVLSDTEEYRINGATVPGEIVRSRMLKLTGDDICLAINQFSRVREKIHNVRSYMISVLFNASVTSNAYITNDVRQWS